MHGSKVACRARQTGSRLCATPNDIISAYPDRTARLIGSNSVRAVPSSAFFARTKFQQQEAISTIDVAIFGKDAGPSISKRTPILVELFPEEGVL